MNSPFSQDSRVPVGTNTTPKRDDAKWNLTIIKQVKMSSVMRPIKTLLTGDTVIIPLPELAVWTLLLLLFTNVAVANRTSPVAEVANS